MDDGLGLPSLSSGTYCQPSLSIGMFSLECCTQITGTSSVRALSTSVAMFAITASRSCAPSITLFCTSITTSADPVRPSSVVMTVPFHRSPTVRTNARNGHRQNPGKVVTR